MAQNASPTASAADFARAPDVATAPAKAKRSPRRFSLPLILIGAAAYGAHWAYDYFVEGRFLVSTDDAYVGANTVIVSPKIMGYITEVLIKNNQEVRAGDVLARIDAGDYQLAVDAANYKVATQDATINRIARQADAQKAAIGQAEAQVNAAFAQEASAAADMERASLEFTVHRSWRRPTSVRSSGSNNPPPTRRAPRRRSPALRPRTPPLRRRLPAPKPISKS
jgi:membrane fusion protein (multidrug efflux system)